MPRKSVIGHIGGLCLALSACGSGTMTTPWTGPDLGSVSARDGQSVGDLAVTPAPDLGPPRPSPIASENQLPGGTGWRLSAPTNGLEAFVDHQSYAPGDLVIVHAAAAAATRAGWELWRLGYYGGAGGRRVAMGGPVTIPLASSPVLDPSTGAVSASWPATFSLTLDASAPTGIYLLKLTSSSAQSYALLVVREPTPQAPILYPVAVNTYQAYNAWGGTSLYDNRRGDWPAAHAYAVSFDRPFAQGDGAGQLFYADQSFVYFIEGQGYDVAYATDTDLDADPTLAAGRRLVTMEGHSEYWTAAMRDGLESALAQGTHLAFFGANDCYWQVRYAPGRRLLYGYKDLASLDPAMMSDPAHVTTRWRDPPVDRPENALLGAMFGEWLVTAAPFVPADASHWIWTGSGMTQGGLVPGLFGFEVDRRFANGAEPAGLTEIGGSLVENHTESFGHASTTIYTAPSGAQVFSTGTMTWPVALSREGAWDARIQIATANLISRFAGDGTLGAGNLKVASLPPGPAAYQVRPGVQVSTVTTALSAPTAVAALPSGDAIVLDDNRVVRVSASGTVTPIAGGPTPGDADGAGLAAAFNAPRGLTVLGDGTLYVADTGNHKIRRISTTGVVTTLAGSTEGYAEGVGAAARFDTPVALVQLPMGGLLVADLWNSRLRAVTFAGATSTWVGTGVRGIADGPGATAQVYFPLALARMPDGSIVWPEAETGLIRRMRPDPAHTVSILAGELGRIGWQDGPAQSAETSEIISLAARPNGDLVLFDTAAYRVRLLAAGMVVTLAGGGRRDPVDGPGDAAGFYLPRAGAFAPDGSLLVADTGNHALRRLTIP